jgi:SAM-dependent methyltransferase
MNCIICAGEKFSPIRKLFDDRYGFPIEYDLMRCNQCGHLSTFPLLLDSDLSDLYENFYPRKKISSKDIAREAENIRSPFGSLYKWLMGTNNEGQYSVKPEDVLLDIGCGAGKSLCEARLLKAIPYGIEADPNVRKIADELGVQVHIGQLADNPFPSVKFDLIILNQVIEHLPNPARTLEKMKSRLSNRGRAILVFPNTKSIWKRVSGDRWINWHIPYHQHHFEIRSFEKLANQCGYDVVNFRTITPNVWSFLQLASLFTNPRLGERSRLWNHQINIQPQAYVSKSNLGCKQLLKKTAKFFIYIPITIFNRVIDQMRLGDSIVIEIKPKPR